MLLWAATPPRIKYPPPPPRQVSGIGKAFPAAQAPSRRTHRLLRLHSPQPAPEIHPPDTPHHKKEHKDSPTSKTLYSSLSYRPASSTPLCRLPSSIWLCSFSLLMTKDTANTTFRITLVCGEGKSKGLRQLRLKYQSWRDTIA